MELLHKGEAEQTITKLRMSPEVCTIVPNDIEAFSHVIFPNDGANAGV